MLNIYKGGKYVKIEIKLPNVKQCDGCLFLNTSTFVCDLGYWGYKHFEAQTNFVERPQLCVDNHGE